MDILDVDLHHLKHDVDDDHHALLDSAAAAVLDDDTSHALPGAVGDDDDEEESGVTLPDDDDDDAALRQLSMRSNTSTINSNSSKRRKIGKALQLILLRKYVQCAKQLDHLPSRATTEQLLEEGYDEFYFHGGSLREPRLGYTAFLKLVRNRRGEVMRQTRDLQTLSHGRGSRRNQKERMEIRTLIDELEQVRQSTMRSPLDYEALDGSDATGSSSGGTISMLSSAEHSVAGSVSHRDDVSPTIAAGASVGSLIGAADLQESDDVLISREKLDMMLRFAQETLKVQKKILDERRRARLGPSEAELKRRASYERAADSVEMESRGARVDEADTASVTSCSSTSSFPEETTPKNAKSDMHGPSTSAAGWGTNAFELMKDRATIAKNHLAPQIVSMREKTSKRMEKYQPSIDKVKSSASAAASMGREKMTPALNRVKEGSTQGWSILKTKLASAAPVAEKIQTMGLNVVTDMWVGDMNVEIVLVEHPARLNCRFLDEYKKPATPPAFETRLSKLRLTRSVSSNSTSSNSDAQSALAAPSSLGAQCLENRFILGNILLLCGDVQVLARMACVNKACKVFISSEKRLWRFCVRYGDIPQSIRASFWEHVASVESMRKSSELDFDTYLHMALSKGECTELILTDVRRTYGRVAPHKHPPNAKGEVVMDTDQELIDQLSEILHALSGRYPDVGYCQGMDYIAAHVLDNVKKSSEARDAARAAQRLDSNASDTDTDSESAPLSPGRTSQSAATRAEVETAFWILVSLFENYGLRQMFSPGLHRLQVHCFQLQRLFELTLPALAEHFEREKVVAEMFTVGWFQTLFLYLNVLPRATLDRIWDIFLMENNWKIMLRVAVAILQLSEEHVVGKPIDEMMQFLNTFGGKSEELLAADTLIERALSVKVTNNVLTKLQRQHARRKKATPERK